MQPTFVLSENWKEGFEKGLVDRHHSMRVEVLKLEMVALKEVLV